MHDALDDYIVILYIYSILLVHDLVELVHWKVAPLRFALLGVVFHSDDLGFDQGDQGV